MSAGAAGISPVARSSVRIRRITSVRSTANAGMITDPPRRRVRVIALANASRASALCFPWRPRADDVHVHLLVRPRPAVVTGIKLFHTLAWLSIESCVAYVLYAGFAGRSDRRVGLAAAVVAGETLVFAGNGFQCPLTELAERYGAQHGSVTDIYLPRWFAHNMPAIHAPLLMLMGYLHARNLIRPAEPSRKPIQRWTGSDSRHPPAGNTPRSVLDARTAVVRRSTG